MLVELDRADETPLYIQISRQLREQIRGGSLTPGYRLPPERRLAAMLGVNRTTVVNAYRELAGDGLIISRVGQGTRVAQPGELLAVPDEPALALGRSPARLPWEQLFTAATEVAQDPLLADVQLVAARPDVISFASGVPSPDLYPIEQIRSLLDEALHQSGQSLLQYCPTEGYMPLREVLADWMARFGDPVDPASVVVVSGSQQGLYLLARTLLEPGDVVAVESPTYLGAIQVFRSVGARLLPIPVDEEGMRVELLEESIGRRRPKLIYTLPTFQNPTGATLSLERRRRLLALAARHQVPIIEDDPYGALRYEGRSLPSLHALDEAGTVIYLSTISKMLFPGFRIGWLAAPRPVIERLGLMKQIVDLDTNPLAQWAVWAFLERGLLVEHVERLRAVYPQRRDQMLAALARACGGALELGRPEGGFYLWGRLTGGLRSRDLLPQAARRGVAFAPGAPFHLDGGGEATLRLNFTLPDEAAIEVGVARLAAALAALGAGQDGFGERRVAAATPIV
ncbi:MAG TPA: PLP-dependent aminotransferase family protein [Nitrolancea sp.]|nr:PLP-dependent aminotransferase family protein [Nitrolancea sp.]